MNALIEKKHDSALSLRYLIAFLIHHLFGTRVYYIEHYPLETLFLYHYRKIKKSFYQTKNNTTVDPREICSNLKQLTKDFKHKENSLLKEAKVLFLEKCKSIKKVKFVKKDIEISKDINTFLNFNAYRYLSWIIFFFLFFAGLFSYSNANHITIKILDGINYMDIFYIYSLLAIIVFYGINLMKSLQPVIDKAFKKNLYVSSEDNNSFLLIAQSIKSDFRKSKEISFGVIGAYIGLVLASMINHMIDLVDQETLNMSEILISMLLNLVLLILIYPMQMIPIIYASMSTKLWDMPKEGFAVDVYHPNGKSNVEELITFINYGMLYNGMMYLIAFLFIPMYFFPEIANNLILYLVVTFLLILPRVRSFRMFRKVKIGLKQSIHQTINQEKEALKNTNIPLSERELKYNHLSQLSTYPKLELQTKRFIINLIGMFIFPLFLALLSFYLDK